MLNEDLVSFILFFRGRCVRVCMCVCMRVCAWIRDLQHKAVGIDLLVCIQYVRRAYSSLERTAAAWHSSNARTFLLLHLSYTLCKRGDDTNCLLMLLVGGENVSGSEAIANRQRQAQQFSDWSSMLFEYPLIHAHRHTLNAFDGISTITYPFRWYSTPHSSTFS